MIKNKINKPVQKTPGKYKQSSENNKASKKNTLEEKGKSTTMQIEYEDIPDLPHPHEVDTPTAKQKNSQGSSKQKKQPNMNVLENKKNVVEISGKSRILAYEDSEEEI